MAIVENSQEIVYKNRINKVFQYIEDHIDGDLSLTTIAEIAAFSPFHFHRIFRTITQETLLEYTTRKRVERAALDLIHKNIRITEISHRCGFNDTATFARTFKKYYNLSPTAFRKQHPNKFSKIRQLQSKNGQVYPNYEKYICIITNLKNWIRMNAKVEVKELAQMDLAYVSSMGPQHMESAFQKLIRWATPQGLMHEQTKMVVIYHDSFKVTPADKVRMSACILIKQPLDTKGEIGHTSIGPGKCIVGRFEITLNEFEKSWTGLFIWMNENGYKKAAKNPFEIYHNNFNEHPEKKAIVDFCIPVE